MRPGRLENCLRFQRVWLFGLDAWARLGEGLESLDVGLEAYNF